MDMLSISDTDGVSEAKVTSTSEVLSTIVESEVTCTGSNGELIVNLSNQKNTAVDLDGKSPKRKKRH